MSTYLVSSLLVSEGKVTGVLAQQLLPAAGGGTYPGPTLELDSAALERLLATDKVFVVDWTGANVGPGSQIRAKGTRFVSVDKDGVENDDLMKLGQHHG